MAEDNEKIREEETMPIKDLPQDLIEYILSRLPVKSLLRFRCVCKAWSAIITDPAFVQMHIRQSLASNSNLSLILRGTHFYSLDLEVAFEQEPAVKLDLPFNSSDCTTEVVGSCNGLLCIASYGLTWYHKDDIFLWNLSTRRYKKLPFTPIECPIEFRIAHLIGYGFGYDPITDDYKLVRVVQSYGKDDSSWHSEVKVYSLSTNSWRRIENMPFHLGTRLIGVHANSALYWVADRFERPFSSPTIVVSFDLKDEEYREVPLPDFVDLKFCMTIGVLGGQLALCNLFGLHLEVWVLKDYSVKNSWTKQFMIEGPSIRSLKFVRPICYSKNGAVILQKNSNALVLCDPRSTSASGFRIRSLNLVETELYVGSLVSLVSKRKLSEDKEQEATNRKRKRKGAEADVESGRLAMN